MDRKAVDADLFTIIQDVYLYASLISAALISVERFYAICCLLKHSLGIIFEVSVSRTIHSTADFINYFDSFVNPIVYALRMPEIRKKSLCCFKRQTVMDNIEGNRKRDDRFET